VVQVVFEGYLSEAQFTSDLFLVEVVFVKDVVGTVEEEVFAEV
jgi:hypothetical protein